MPPCFLTERGHISESGIEGHVFKRKEDRRAGQTDSSGTKITLLKERCFFVCLFVFNSFWQRLQDFAPESYSKMYR